MKYILGDRMISLLESRISDFLDGIAEEVHPAFWNVDALAEQATDGFLEDEGIVLIPSDPFRPLADTIQDECARLIEQEQHRREDHP